MTDTSEQGNYYCNYVSSYSGIDYLYESQRESYIVMSEGFNLNRNWSLPLLF